MNMFSRRGLVIAALASGGVATAQSGPCGVPNLETDEGPFRPVGDVPIAYDLTRTPLGAARGESIWLHGAITSASCDPIAGARVLIWQTDSEGRYRHPEASDRSLDTGFLYYALQTTGSDGRYWFKTIMPQPYVFRDLRRARHIHIEVAHERHGELTSEVYFAGPEEDARRRLDEVWASRDRKRRHELIVAPSAYDLPDFEAGADACERAYRFDVRLS